MKLTLKHALASIILVLSFSVPVAAAPPDDLPEMKALDAVGRGGFANAVKFSRIAAYQGNPNGEFLLGMLYQTGQGVPKSAVDAVKWYRLAAIQGFTPAQSSLGDMYDHGLGIPKDYPEAAKWRRMAADAGDRGDETKLALMYYDGHGVPKDYVRAHMWFSLAAAQGYQAAADGRDIVARHMTAAQIAKAEKLAREWKPTKQPPR